MTIYFNDNKKVTFKEQNVIYFSGNVAYFNVYNTQIDTKDNMYLSKYKVSHRSIKTLATYIIPVKDIIYINYD